MRDMATASSLTPTYWSEMTMLVLLFIPPFLPHLSLGEIAVCGSGSVCPQGECCNYDGLCGTTDPYCGARCASQCPASRSRCGPSYSNGPCPVGSCCSLFGWCGWDNSYCGEKNCTAQCPNATCGFNGSRCADGDCCSIRGYCSNTDGYCDVGSCASQCPPIPPSPAPTPGGLFPAAGGPIPARPKSSGNKLGTVVGISVGVVAFLAVSIVIAFFLRRSGGKGQLGRILTEEDSTMQLEGMPERFSYKQLSVATRAFSPESKLGQGGFGSVYRGVLPSTGVPVAVKKINSDSNQGEKEFMAEVSIISRLRHRNLIQLQGWCKDVAREKYLLVYELMPNGSLDKALFGSPDIQTTCLSWSQRFNILTGTAAAVDYLHQGWKQQVIHRDIKASNVMLDEQWNAKLGDFGLARLVDHQRAAATTVVAGTYGYIAPEAASSGRFTDKTDVFAFGAVVLEVACGRTAFSAEFPADEIILVDWVWECLSQGALLSTVDNRLVDYDTYWMKVVLIVGLLCSHPDPLARPSMRHVVQVLAGDVPVPTVPASKPAPVYRSKNVSIDFLRDQKSGSTSKSWGSSKSRSGSISLVRTKTWDSTQGTTIKSLGTSSSFNSSFPEKVCSGDGLAVDLGDHRS